MKAPTNIYGPDGKLCKKGETIPADWFKKVPDLQTHLDNVERAPVPDEAPAAKATVTEDSGTVVRAKANIVRKRGNE